MNVLLRIASYTLKFKPYLFLGYLCTIGAVTSYLMIPELLGGIVDKIDPNSNNDSIYKSIDLYTLLFILFILGCTRGLFSYGQNYFGEALSFQVTKILRDELYDKTQKLDFYFHNKTHTGEMMARVIVDIEGMRNFIPMGIIRSPYVFFMFFGAIILLLIKNVELALYACSFLVIAGLIAAKMRLKLRQIWLKVQEKNAELNALLQENLNGIKVVKAFYAEDHQIDKFGIVNDELKSETVKVENFRAVTMTTVLFAYWMVLGLVLAVGGIKVINGDMDIGDLTSFMFYLQLLAMPVRMIGWLLNASTRGATCGNRIFDILDTDPEIKNLSNINSNYYRMTGKIEFKNISHKFPDGTINSLENINLTISKDQKISITGEAGSGKSTLVQLLLRFYDPTKGSILIDGVDIKKISLGTLRQNIGYVHQDVFIFNETFKNNIKYGKPDATDQEIMEVAKVAQIDDYIQSLPEKYDSLISENGANLSGGQKQRISIARTLLLDPPILILDDSTSSVDATTEKEIQNSLDKLAKGRTVINIAHKLNNFNESSNIIVMKEGIIIESGNHNQLLEADGVYKNIYNLQISN
ncbi:MAG: ABC transporter ATP-binding protein [Dehalococcoidia bacterium]